MIKVARQNAEIADLKKEMQVYCRIESADFIPEGIAALTR